MKSLFKNRIKRMEQKVGADLFQQMDFIQSGMCYDELSDEQKELYCNYLNVHRVTYEQLQIMVMGTLHTEVGPKPKPSTPQQLQQIITEVKTCLLEENK